MSNLTDFFPSGGGGGLTPKFEEFNSSGTFTPTQALIDAGGYIEVFLVGGGAVGTADGPTYDFANAGGSGGETIFKSMYLTSTSNITVLIGGSISVTGDGNQSSFAGSTAGGVDVVSLGGQQSSQSGRMGSGFGSIAEGNEAYRQAYRQASGASSGVMGYGGGGRAGRASGITAGKQNSGQGSSSGQTSGSGYCIIKWYE